MKICSLSRIVEKILLILAEILAGVGVVGMFLCYLAATPRAAVQCLPHSLENPQKGRRRKKRRRGIATLEASRNFAPVSASRTLERPGGRLLTAFAAGKVFVRAEVAVEQ